MNSLIYFHFERCTYTYCYPVSTFPTHVHYKNIIGLSKDFLNLYRLTGFEKASSLGFSLKPISFSPTGFIWDFEHIFQGLFQDNL